MSDNRPGVGVNGEPDDFAARYDRFARGAAMGWVLKTLAALTLLLVAIGVASKLLLG